MIPLSCFYSWKNLPEERIPEVFAEFKANGCRELVLTSDLLDRIMKEPAFLLRLMRMAESQSVCFSEAHGIWGPALGLGVGAKFPSLIPPMRAAHKQAFAFCADIGCRTYTIHMGAYEHIYFGTGVESIAACAKNALHELIPAAEKNKIVLALENNCDNPGNADALAPVFHEFPSPWFGCCFDVGHAHYLKPEPGKKPFLYECGLEQNFCENSLEKLSPHIVTAHLHDNDGTGDWHRLPGRGTIDWKPLIRALKQCPRLLSLQPEVDMTGNQVSMRELVETFQALLRNRKP